MKKILVLFLTIAAGVIGCSKSDDYKRYNKDGELVYPAKADSLKGYAGHGRVLLEFLLESDLTITGVRVYWNNRTDSMDLSVKRGNAVDTIRSFVTGLGDGSYNFEVMTYDGAGNFSVPVNVSVKSYGDKYEATLLNIPIQFSTLIPPGNAFIVWGAYDPNSGLIGAEVKYTDVDGVDQDAIVPIGNTSPTATFAGMPAGGTLQYRAMYLPEATAVDTFYTAYSTIGF